MAVLEMCIARFTGFDYFLHSCGIQGCDTIGGGRCQAEKISSVCSSSSNHNHDVQKVVGVLCGGLLVFDCLGSHMSAPVEELAITSSLQKNKMRCKIRLQTSVVYLCYIYKFLY